MFKSTARHSSEHDPREENRKGLQIKSFEVFWELFLVFDRSLFVSINREILSNHVQARVLYIWTGGTETEQLTDT